MLRLLRTTTRRALPPRLAVSTLDAAKLEITRCATNATPPANDALVGQWGRIFSPHMLTVDWTVENGWATPVIEPHTDLRLSPAAMALHYALQCFEGMKAYRGEDDQIRLFRPELNATRMTSSLERLAMPTFDQAQFVELLKRFVAVESAWVPRGEGHSMYLRPTCIATDPFLGVGVPRRAKLFVVASPVGPYFPDGFKPITVVADAANVRAWPGGAGDTKVGGNYAPTIKPAQDASKATAGKAQQVLYLFGDDHRVTEVGAMNVFVVWKTREGSVELVTAPLDYGDILPGVTRRSVLDLAAADPAGCQGGHHTARGAFETRRASERATFGFGPRPTDRAAGRGAGGRRRRRRGRARVHHARGPRRRQRGPLAGSLRRGHGGRHLPRDPTERHRNPWSFKTRMPAVPPYKNYGLGLF